MNSRLVDFDFCVFRPLRYPQGIRFATVIFSALLNVFPIAGQKLELDSGTRGRIAAAQQYEQAHDYASASREYEQILSVNPKLAIIRQSLAITYHLRSRYPEAIAEFQRALAIDSSLWGSELFLGMDYYKVNDFKAALAPLERSILLNAKMAEPEARFWLGEAYSALGRPEQAVKELRRSAELRPKDVDVLYRLARAYDLAASSAYRRLGEINPESALVSLLQADRFAGENRTELARVEYQRALQLRPDLSDSIPAAVFRLPPAKATDEAPVSAYDARSTLELVALYRVTGEIDQARVLLQRLTAQKPADAEAAKSILEARGKLSVQPAMVSQSSASTALLNGVKLFRNGQFADAKRFLEQASEHNKNWWLTLYLARAYSESNGYSRAEELLGKLLKTDPQNLDALYFEGRHYKRLAAQTLQQMIDIDRNSYGVHELLGEQYEDRTEYEQAIREYKAGLAISPDSGGIRYAIGNVYWKLRQYDEARHWLEEELLRNPFHGLAHYLLGDIGVEQGNADEAIRHLQAALQSRPNLAGAHFDLGRAFALKGQYPDAIAAFEAFAASEPDNDRVHYLLANAYRKQGQPKEAQAEMVKYQELTRKRLRRTQQDVREASERVNQSH